MQRAVIYMRHSTDDQKAKDEQLKVCNDLAKDHDLEVVKIYEDCDKSRPQWQNILNDAKAGGFNCVIFSRVERVTRSLETYRKYLRQLEKFNVRVITKTNKDYDKMLSLIYGGL